MNLPSLDEIMASIPPKQQPGRTVAAGTPPPYEIGDIVAVAMQPIFDAGAKPRWVPGMILSCVLPPRGRRFTCRVVVGASTHSHVEIPRAYCWEDGTGEGLVRLNEDNPGDHLDVLNLTPPSVDLTRISA